MNRGIRLNRHTNRNALEENSGNARLLFSKNCLQLHHRRHIHHITQLQIAFSNCFAYAARLHFLVKLVNHELEQLLLAQAYRKIVGCRIDEALSLKNHIGIIRLHISIGRVIFRRSDKLISTAKALCLQLFGRLYDREAFRYSKAHLLDASLDHSVDNLCVAHAALKLISTCLQLRRQSLPACLHTKGIGILDQLLFMQQRSNIRRRHALLDDNQTRAVYSEILVASLSVKVDRKRDNACNQHQRQSAHSGLHRLRAYKLLKLFYIHLLKSTTQHKNTGPKSGYFYKNYSSSAHISSYRAATASYSSSVGPT